MRFNRHSIFLKLNLLFLVATLSITIVFFIFFIISEKRQAGIVFKDSRQIFRMIRTANKIDPSDLPSMLQEEGFEVITDKEKILKKAQSVKYPKNLPPPLKKRLHGKRLQIVKLDSDYYYHINLPRHHLLVKNKSYPNNFIWLLLAYFSILSIILLIYLALWRSLKPIQKLESEIKKFGEGNLNIDTKSENKDEIASVANQFHNAVQKIDALQKTRTLFMRNMMHELKTPLTKGKLSLSLMEENREKAMLAKVFDKLESLINEMADIEQITTQNIQIEKTSHLVINLINHAKELLYLEDDQITYQINGQVITCDFKLFSIALKNLIDNAIKYSYDHKVSISADAQSITISNHAAPLKYAFEHYLEPFYKGELTSTNQKGFGLGLYIVSEVVKLHGFTLKYKHADGSNIFTIKL